MSIYMIRNVYFVPINQQVYAADPIRTSDTYLYCINFHGLLPETNQDIMAITIMVLITVVLHLEASFLALARHTYILFGISDVVRKRSIIMKT